MKMRSLILLALSAVLTATFVKQAYAADSTSNGNNRILWTQNFPGMVSDCAFMPDENYIIIAHDTLLEIRRTIDDSLIKAIDVFNNTVSLDVSKDGKYVAISGDIRLLDINTLEVVKDFKRAGVSVSLSPDNKRIAFGCQGYAYILDVETGQQLFKYGRDSLDSAPMYMWYVKFSPDGKWLACAYEGLDHNIYVYDTDSFKIWAIFNQDDKTNGVIHNLLFSPNSQYLLAGGAEGVPHYGGRMWDIQTKQEIILKDYPMENPLIIFNDNETIYTNTYPFNSHFYNFKTYESVALNITPPFGYPVLNKDETLLLGDRLGLMQIDKSILSVSKDNSQTQEDMVYPNPSTGEVTIKINFPYDEVVIINLTDVSGHQIKNLMNSFSPKGLFEFHYNTTTLPVGTYFIQVTQKDFTKTFKLVKEG